MFFGSAALGTLTGLISAVVSRLSLCYMTFKLLCMSPSCCLNSLTHRLVSETLWPEEDSFTGVWHDDNLCVPSLRPGWRHQTFWWGQTHTLSLFHFQAWLHETFFFNAFCSPTGIMSILFAGIVMSHYTHHNLSPVTQILMQQTLRTVAFMCGAWILLSTQVSLCFHLAPQNGNAILVLFLSAETCVFAFLGLSIFSFPHKFEISFVIWCIVSDLTCFSWNFI